MSYTKKQISNFLNDKILFRFSISDSNLIDFNQQEELFTFDELEKVIKSNLEYWKTVSEKVQNNYFSRWANWSNKVASTREYFTNLEELDLSNINNYLYSYLSSSRELREQDKFVYILSIHSPIDKDPKIRQIRSFVSFYTQETSGDNFDEAIENFIHLYKNNNYIGNKFSSSYSYQFYPALYLLRKNFSNIRENISDFEANIIAPLTTKLHEISDDSDRQFSEITAFTENKHNEIQEQFNEKVSELNDFQTSLNEWQKEKYDKLSDLEETYKNKLSLEAPEQLWNERAIEHRKQARNWTIVLIVSVFFLLLASVKLVNAMHAYSTNVVKEIPFISESFILISVISFFIYIIRVLIKIVMSNHHLATEYKQKAALTRFYQSLTYAGTDIAKEERLIIVNALFSRVETGLVKTDNTSESDTLLAILLKSIK